MDSLMGLISQIPGLVVEHWAIGIVVGVIILGLGYLAVLKARLSWEDLRDIKRRNRNR